MKKEPKEQPVDDVSIRTLVESDKIELIDTLDTAESNEEITFPYLNGLYQDLVLRSDAPDKGIPRVFLIEVLFRPLPTLLVLEPAGNNRRTVLHAV